MVARSGDPAELADLIAACGPGVSGGCTGAKSLPCAAWLVAGGKELEHDGSLVQTKQVSGWRRDREPCGPSPRRRFVLLPRLDERF
jgi:hypothetical protein